MDQSNEHCVNCTMLNKELNLLRRKVSLLNLEIDELKSYPKPSDNSSNNKGCQTELSGTEIETECESSSSNITVSSINLNLTHELHPSQNDKLNVFSYDTINQELVEPCSVIPGSPFEHVNCNDLDRSTEYTKHFQNRQVAYYGDFPYVYGGAVHQPRPMSSNPSLGKVLDHVKLVLPDFNFNSVLITKYRNGNCYLPYHSDKEESIYEDSSIATISLGQSRVIKFRSIADHGSEFVINLSHGHVFTMSKKSQKFFEHSIPKDFTKQPRISLTLRFIKPPDNIISTQDIRDVLYGLGGSQPSNPESENQYTETYPTNSVESMSENNVIKTPSPKINTPISDASPPPPQEKPVTIYISSSMFRYLDAKRLSSTSQDCYVFFYPGASAGQMLTHFRNDPKAKSINLSLVRKVMLLTGSNNVDSILGDPSGGMYNRTVSDISKMVNFLEEIMPAVSINIINVLPRKGYQRNLAVNQINNYLYNFCRQANNVNFVNTEVDRNLFTTKQGFRKSFYFVPDSSRIYDNVHLNRSGIVRLAKHLKYVAHNS